MGIELDVSSRFYVATSLRRMLMLALVSAMFPAFAQFSTSTVSGTSGSPSTPSEMRSSSVAAARFSATTLDVSAALRVGSVLMSRDVKVGSRQSVSRADLRQSFRLYPSSFVSAALTQTLIGRREFRLAPAALQDLATVRTRLLGDEAVEPACKVKTAFRRSKAAGEAWSALQNELWREGRDPIADSLPHAIQLVVELHSDPIVRVLAQNASRELLSCSANSREQGDVQVIAMALSVPEAVVGEDPANVVSAHTGISSIDRAGERGLYPVNRIGDELRAPLLQPRICLAMSGGGIRSAAFQIGVLQGLHEQGLLRSVDIMSAVSGGAYAMSWFLASRLKEAGDRLDSPLRAYYLQDAYLRRAGIAITKTLPELERRLSHSMNFMDALAPPSIHSDDSSYKFLSNDLLDAGDAQRAQLASTSEGLLLAVSGILGTAVEMPYDALENELPALLLEHRDYRELLAKAYGIPRLTLSNLAGKLRAIGDLPFPIYNAAVRPSDCMAIPSPSLGLAENLDQTLFELTPLHVGTRNPGYSLSAPNMYLMGEATAISGAAIDFPEGFRCRAVNAGYVRLGAKVCGDDTPCRLITDGGYADNLGLASLTDRDCDAIVIADAEHDPGLTFESYQRTAAGLQKAGRAVLLSNELANLVATTSRPCTVKDVPSCFTAAKAETADWNERARHEDRAYYSATLARVGASERPTDVLYLKLAVDEDVTYDDLAIDTAIDLPCESRDCSFPHIPTTQQSIDERHYRGLRHLGRSLITRALKDDNCEACVSIRTVGARQP